MRCKQPIVCECIHHSYITSRGLILIYYIGHPIENADNEDGVQRRDNEDEIRDDQIEREEEGENDEIGRGDEGENDEIGRGDERENEQGGQDEDFNNMQEQGARVNPEIIDTESRNEKLRPCVPRTSLRVQLIILNPPSMY